MKIEYQVRPVTRYIVTRYEEDGTKSSSQPIGEFETEKAASYIRAALEKTDTTLPSGPDAAYVAHREHWRSIARPGQVPPSPENQAGWVQAQTLNDRIITACAEPWQQFGVVAGRGHGKDRLGAEWLFSEAWEAPKPSIWGLVAPTSRDVPFAMFDGSSSLLSVIPEECLHSYSRTHNLITLANGSSLAGYSADRSNRLRYAELSGAFLTEVAAWPGDAIEVFESAFVLRSHVDNPKIVWATTPRKGSAILKYLTTPAAKRLVIRGTSYDNADNLPKSFLSTLKAYEGTDLGWQEILGELE